MERRLILSKEPKQKAAVAQMLLRLNGFVLRWDTVVKPTRADQMPGEVRYELMTTKNSDNPPWDRKIIMALMSRQENKLLALAAICDMTIGVCQGFYPFESWELKYRGFMPDDYDRSTVAISMVSRDVPYLRAVYMREPHLPRAFAADMRKILELTDEEGMIYV